MFLYETHVHSKYISRCSEMSAEMLIDLYVKNGYDGLILTDHFIRGNNVTCQLHPEYSYEEKIHCFFDGVREVKKVAPEGFDVFGAFEISYAGTDVLVYGFSEDQIVKMTELETLPMREVIDFCNERGGLTVQAHPFREASYIDHVRLYSGAMGVEIMNSARDELCNALAKSYYETYNAVRPRLFTGGSDLHHPNQKILSGMEFETRLTSIEDFCERIKRKEGRIVVKENVLVNPENK